MQATLNRTLLATLTAGLLAAFAANLAHAAPDATRAAAAEKWKSMTPEQREAAKAKAKEKWDAMTPEQQEAAKKRFAEKHPRAAARMADKQGEKAAAEPAK